MLGVIGKQKFTKAVVLSAGATVIEIDVSHESSGRRSSYSPLKLLRLGLHVLVGFWPRPIQLIGLTLGIFCTVGATAVGLYGIVYWITNSDFPGPLLGGDAAIAILGVQGFILALIGEYLARMQRDIEGRPLYTVDRDLS